MMIILTLTMCLGQILPICSFKNRSILTRTQYEGQNEDSVCRYLIYITFYFVNSNNPQKVYFLVLLPIPPCLCAYQYLYIVHDGYQTALLLFYLSSVRAFFCIRPNYQFPL